MSNDSNSRKSHLEHQQQSHVFERTWKQKKRVLRTYLMTKRKNPALLVYLVSSCCV